MKSRLLPVMPLLALAACAYSADHPSLAPRPIEQALVGALPAESPPPVATDSATKARVSTLLDEAKAATTRFDAEFAKAQAAVGQAIGAAPGSEAWVVAEQMISRAEAARGPLTTRLADLDRIVATQGAVEESLLRSIEALAATEARQRTALAQLEASLSRP